MGLKLRIASAKVLLAASVFTMLATTSAYAFPPPAVVDPCTVDGTAISITTSGLNVVAMDTNATISGAPAATGVAFEPSSQSVNLMVNNQAKTNSSADGIAIDDSINVSGGLFSDVCYVGAATAAITAVGDGLDMITGGNGSIAVTVGHAINAGGTGIYVDRLGSGDVSISTAGDITAGEDGIFVTHGGSRGSITVNTAAGSKITAIGAGSGPFGLGSGIYIERLNATSSDRVTINNAADIEAGLGIWADICSCGTATLDVTTSGNIKADVGLYLGTAGDANVVIAGGTINADFLGVVQADNANIVVKSGATLVGRLAGLIVDTITSASLTVAGKIDATGGTAILFASSANILTLEPGYEIDGDVQASGSSMLSLGGASGSDAFDLDRLSTQFFGFTNFQKTGGSTWTLTDTATYGDFMGVIDAYDGKLKINSAIPDLDIILHGTAAIGGNGSFSGLDSEGGILAPGNSIGTLTVANANLVGVTYQVETNTAGASDKLIVTGTDD